MFVQIPCNNRNSPGTWQLLDHQCKQEVPLASSKPHAMPVQPETSREGVIDSRTKKKMFVIRKKKAITFSKTSLHLIKCLRWHLHPSK